MIERDHPSLSLGRQADLLGVSRSGLYISPPSISLDDKDLMNVIDRIFTAHPYYGYRRITVELGRQNQLVNHKRVLRLMRKMNIMSIAPGPMTSVRHPQHKIYPYLLRNMAIIRPNQVWCVDITYVPMEHGFMFLVAVLDWYSRHVLAWRLSNTCEVGFCLEALEEALASGSHPEIFNSDQGSQFTSDDFTGMLLKHGIRISMDGKGRALDNIIVERFWRNVKYECVYLHAPKGGRELHQLIKDYMEFYTYRRGHQSLDYATPSEYYLERKIA
jgi:putative transposase